MKKSLLLVLFILFLFITGFAQWQKAKLPANNAILSLAVDYATSYVYAGSAGNGVYLSSDTGATWSTANTGLPANLNVCNILVLKKNIFLATNDGVYLSANNGNSWEQAGLKSVLVNSFTSYNSGDTSFLYAGTEKGIYLSINNGLSWSMFAFTSSGVSAVFSNSPYDFYAGMTAGGLNYYEDYRKIWVAADTGVTTNVTVKSLTHLAGSFPGLGLLFGNTDVGTNRGVYVEKSKGNWIQANIGLASDTVVNSIISSMDLYKSGYIPIYDAVLLGSGIDTGNVYLLHSPAKNYYWSALSTGIDGSVNALAMYRNTVFAGGSSLWVLKSDLKYLYLSDFVNTLSATGDTATIKVFSNDSWFIQTNNYDWLSFSPNTGTGDTTITVIAAPNNTGSMRFGFAMINAAGGSLLNFYQDGGSELDINNSISTNISIYPVPVKDDMVITFPDQYSNLCFAIYNLSGVELLAATLTGYTTKINMRGFNPGVYVLKIVSDKQVITSQKIIKL
jgi:hypothetical protein